MKVKPNQLARKFSILITFFLIFSISAQTYGDSQFSLPEIGDPASTELSKTEEIELGKLLLAEVRGHLPVANDPELSDYIHSLGTRITSAGLDSNFPFTFVYIADSTVNAFALPGGIVAVNSGLVMLAENESELAGVMSHEISHVAQRHIARAYANAKSMNVLSALALLGTILATAYNSDVGRVAAYSSLGAAKQQQLAFSRAFEQEADRIGMQMLVSANLDPQGMPSFFEKLAKHNQLNRGEPLEFLSTHPVTSSRITDTKERAVQYVGKFTKNTIHFDLMKARTIAVTMNPNQLIQRYEQKRKSKENISPLDQYIYSLALSRIGRGPQAISELQNIQIEENAKLAVKLAMAQAYIADGQFSSATQLLRDLDAIYPDNSAVVYYLATSLIEQNQAREALNKLDTFASVNHNPIFDQLKAKTAAKANIAWLSHESLSDYYSAHGQYGAAMEQLQLALREPSIDHIAKARVENKKSILVELKQKNKDFR